MQNQSTDNVSELLADGLNFGWMRQRTHEELESFINRKHASLPEGLDILDIA